MNLYRNFGNLLESWVTEGYSDLHFQSGTGLDRLDSVSRDSVPLSNVKSESEDSGVETVSTTSPCHSHQCSELTSKESHPVFGSTSDDGQPPSPSPSICSSSSSYVSLGSVAQKATCLEVEQALRRTKLSSWREDRTAEPQYQSNTASFPTSCQLVDSRAHHRFARPRRTCSQPTDPQKAELYRKRLKLHQHAHPIDSQIEFAGCDQSRLDELSPGLLYLEQMCRMLESIAKLQQQNNSLQTELEILKSRHFQIQCLGLREEEINDPASQHLEILDHEDPATGLTLLKEPTEFRHRSVSDTHAISRQRRAKFFRDDQIADVLVEEAEDKDPQPENEHKKQSKIQKLKFASFRGRETKQPDGESNSSHPKKKTKLTNIFRRRMTTRL